MRLPRGSPQLNLVRRLLDQGLLGENEDLAAIDASFGTLCEIDIPDRLPARSASRMYQPAVILVDIDVLIASVHGIDAAREWLRDIRTRTGRLVVSVVTNAEIVGGMRSPERRKVNRLLRSLRPLKKSTLDDATELSLWLRPIASSRAREVMAQLVRSSP